MRNTDVNYQNIKDVIIGLKKGVPSKVLAMHLERRPDLVTVYTERMKGLYVEDTSYTMSFLAEAAGTNQPELFTEYINWAKTFFVSIHVPLKDVSESLEIMQECMHDHFKQAENEIIANIIDKGIFILESTQPDTLLTTTFLDILPVARDYLESLLSGDRLKAQLLVNREYEKGVSVKDIYLNIFQPVQYEIGRLWQTNRINVAQEHYCSAATQVIMSQLHPYIFKGKRKKRKMVATCIQGELHEIGARMVTDFFEMDGWDTHYLGANTPTDAIIYYLNYEKPDLLAISATMTFHIGAVEELVRKIKLSPEVPQNMKIIVGGYPFKIAGDLWKKIGADGYAINASEALKIASDLVHK
ncbi:MAG: cobalamin-dependent protein [Bacteroidetes bacterium]|nr:cobalamin-dependent protein [Bacteroidota bacterium]